VFQVGTLVAFIALVSQGVEVDGVWFRYPAADQVSLASLEPAALPAQQRASDPWVLRDVTFQVPAGKLFHDTIRANLLYARPSATEKELTEACEGARIWELISSLPDGLDTIAGDRGYRFSGGEKQRRGRGVRGAVPHTVRRAGSVTVVPEGTRHLPRERGELPPATIAMSNAEIAAALYITVGTAKTHVARLLAELGARDRVQLVITGYQAGLLDT
jgi:hypothetical protein